MNVIGIDVSKGESHATVITQDFEEKAFTFTHNRSGFRILAEYFKPHTLAVFETTGNYSASVAHFLQENKIDYVELNPYEAKLRTASLRRNKNDRSDSLKLAMLGVTQLQEIKNRGRRPLKPIYQSLRTLALYYHNLVKERSRAINYLISHLELTFPELNNIFKKASGVLALTFFENYAHPDFLIGLTARKITDTIYHTVGKHMRKSDIQSYSNKVWLAAKNSYPAVKSDSWHLPIIVEYCTEIRNYNSRINTVSSQLKRLAASLPDFKIICSIPGVGQLSAALFLGFAGNLDRFDNYKQLNAYLGIDIRRYQSRQYAKRDKINRHGSRYGRSIEVLMIRSMLRNQKKIQNHIINYYYKLKQPPYSKFDKVAVIACANHLNRTIINLVRTNQLYNYQKAIY